MFLQSPASYITLADLKADTTLDLTDPKGNPVPDAILSELLEEHSGAIDAYIKQSFLAQEQTVRLQGNGSNLINLGRRPVIYIKQVKIVLPTTAGFEIPLQSLLVDYQHGTLKNISPLVFQGIGVTSLFPRGIDIDVTMAWGLNYPIPAPTFAATPSAMLDTGNPLPAGNHTVAVASVTINGESLPSAPQTVTLATPGAIDVTITNCPGAIKYYVYVDGVLAGELLAQLLGNAGVAGTVDAGAPPIATAYTNAGTRKTPATTDSTPWPIAGEFGGIRRALKMMIQQTLWEFKNPTNRGLYMQYSGPNRMSFKEGIHSTFAQNIASLLSSLVYQGL